MSGHPDYAALHRLLFVLKRLPDVMGETTLTAEEAARIRSLGFAAEAGPWRVPPLPPELVRDNPLFEGFAVGWNFREAWSASPPQPDASLLAAVPPVAPQAWRDLLLIRELSDEDRLRIMARETAEAERRREEAAQARDAARLERAREDARRVEQQQREQEARKAEVELVAGKILKAVQKARGYLAKRRAQQRLSRHTGIFRDALRELIARGLVVVEGAMIVEVSRVMQDGSDARQASQENRARM